MKGARFTRNARVHEVRAGGSCMPAIELGRSTESGILNNKNINFYKHTTDE